jgi:rhodanese-related sulfurtransferase
MWRTIGQTAVIVLFSSILGLLFNALSPSRLPLVRARPPALDSDRFISLDSARELWSAGAAVFLDARTPDDYAAGHIAGALNLPAAQFEERFPEAALRLSPESRIVAYCDGVECDLSRRLAERLTEFGFTNVQVLPNGWTAWRQAGLATEREPRQ